MENENTHIEIRALRAEIDRLFHHYEHYPMAREALQMVSCWVMEQSVLDEPPDDQPEE